MGWWGRVLGRRVYSVSLNQAGSTFLYREQGRRMRVEGEIMPGGFAVYSSSIVNWEAESGEAPAHVPLIDEAERLRILANIRRYFVERGKVVYLS